MKETIAIFIGISIGIVLLLAIGVDVARYDVNKRFDNCITLAQEYIPDPNETEERSNFIKECYENPNGRKNTN